MWSQWLKIHAQEFRKYLERFAATSFCTEFVRFQPLSLYDQSACQRGWSWIPSSWTQDRNINGYFATANYLDSDQNFFDYLKSHSLYKNSIIVLIGPLRDFKLHTTQLLLLYGKNSDTMVKLWQCHSTNLRTLYGSHSRYEQELGIDITSGEIDMLNLGTFIDWIQWILKVSR